MPAPGALSPTLVEELVVLSCRRDTRKRQFRARDLPGSFQPSATAHADQVVTVLTELSFTHSGGGH